MESDGVHRRRPAHFVCPPCRLDRVDEWPLLHLWSATFSMSLVFWGFEPVFYATGFTPQLVPVCSNTVMLQVLQRLQLRVFSALGL